MRGSDTIYRKTENCVILFKALYLTETMAALIYQKR
jgi:hypothetical protein